MPRAGRSELPGHSLRRGRHEDTCGDGNDGSGADAVRGTDCMRRNKLLACRGERAHADGRQGRGPGQRCSRLAAARHRGRVSRHADQLSRRTRRHRDRRERGGLAQRQPLRQTRALLDGHGHELHPQLAVPNRRAGGRPRARRRRLRDTRKACDDGVHRRPPGSREPGRVSEQPWQRARRAALRLGAQLDPFDGAPNDPRPGRGLAWGPVSRALPRGGLAGTDDLRTGRCARMVPPAAHGLRVEPTSRCSSTRASRCSPGGKGAS